MLIIGDIHGHYKTLKALVKKCPAGPIILAGDLIDRGPRSNKVIEWAIKHSANVTAILGNHDYMLQQYVESPSSLRKSWARNGGVATLESYGRDSSGCVMIPKTHIDFIRAMPLYFATDDLIVTHAPLIDFVGEDLDKASGLFMEEWLWNRNPPSPRKRFQIYGHNSMEGLRFHGHYAVCIDTSASEILTAMHWPSKRIYQQPFID